MGNVGKKAVNGFFWQICALGAQVIFNLIFLAVLGRLISPSAFGILAIFRVILGFVEMFTEFGFGAALIQRKSYNTFHISSAFYATMFSAIFFYSLVALFSNEIVSFYDNKFSRGLLLFFCSILFLRAFGVVSRALMIRDFRFKDLFIAIVVSNLLGNLLVGVGLALMGFGIWSLVLAVVSTNVISSLMLFILKPHYLGIAIRRQEFGEIFNFGMDLTILRFFTQTGMQMDKLVLGKFLNIDTLGRFERSQYLVQLPKAILGGALSNIAFSFFSRLQDDLKKMGKVFVEYLGVISFLMFFLCQFFFCYPTQILDIVLGKQWLSAAPFVRILSLYAYLQVFTRFIDPLIRSQNAMRKAIPIKIVFMVCNVIVLYIAVQEPDNVQRICYLLLLPMFVHGVLMIVLSFRLLKLNIGNIFKILFPTAVLLIYVVFKVALFHFSLYKFISEGSLALLVSGSIIDILYVVTTFFMLTKIVWKENALLLLNYLENSPVRKLINVSNMKNKLK